MSRNANVLGQRFGKLVVISKGPKGKMGYLWHCKCDCGNDKMAYTNMLNAKRIQSCGCSIYQCRYVSDLFPYRWWDMFFRKAKNRNLDFKLKYKDIEFLYTKQNGKCALSGIPIYFPKNSQEARTSVGNVSVDRIDSSKGYFKDNIQLVDKKINMMKQQYSQSEFIKLCKLVAANC